MVNVEQRVPKGCKIFVGRPIKYQGAHKFNVHFNGPVSEAPSTRNAIGTRSVVRWRNAISPFNESPVDAHWFAESRLNGEYQSDSGSSMVREITDANVMSGDDDDYLASDVDDDHMGAPFQSQLINDPADNDVLCGRGGSINSHIGNERFRTLVQKRKRVYLTARFKREKRLIAASIVTDIRNLHPPGRFLIRDKASGGWREIPDDKARDKTSQALRENAPVLRAEIETEICEQRGQRKSSGSSASHRHHEQSHNAQPTHPGHHYPVSVPPPPHYWGYYYGYASPHPGMPPPPPHGYPSHYYPPPGAAPHPSPPPSSSYYHTSPPPSSSYRAPTEADPVESSAKSTLEQTVDLVTSGAETIRKWTEQSFSFGGMSAVSSYDHDDAHSRFGKASVASSKSTRTKPVITYLHHDYVNRKRRIVKFQDTEPAEEDNSSSIHPDQHRRLHENNSMADAFDLEPVDAKEETNDSLMTQVAQHILVQFGSWDTSTLCGTYQADDTRIPFPTSSGPTSASNHHAFPHQPPEQQVYNTDMDDEMMGDDRDGEEGVDWEGQEVQLLEPGRQNERMPPPPRAPPRNSSIGSTQLSSKSRPDTATSSSSFKGLSSLGSCHSWGEQIGNATSFFSGGGNHNDGTSVSFFSGSNGNLPSVGSLDMEYSACGTAENNSVAGGSLGGGSLTNVFEDDLGQGSARNPNGRDRPPNEDSWAASPRMSHRDLNQIPSWERTVRSRSPLSVGSIGSMPSRDDDLELMDADDKVSISSSISPMHRPTPQLLAAATAGGPLRENSWARRE
jgi:hypothetical protein